MIRCAYVLTTVYGHDTCLRARVCVCGGGGGGGVGVSCVCVWANVSVFVLCVTARFSLALRTKIKS